MRDVPPLRVPLREVVAHKCAPTREVPPKEKAAHGAAFFVAALRDQPYRPSFNAIALIPADDKRCLADSSSVAEWNGPRRTRL